nr:MAG TPA: hypothetical protein [Caudoviricetes sp.]
MEYSYLLIIILSIRTMKKVLSSVVVLRTTTLS